MLLGEGAAFLVLEELNHALARNAKIYCEVIAHGRSCEAYHALLPNPDGSGALRAMANALTRAGVALDEVDYINAHGTATLANDRTETVAIQRLFGARAKRVPVSSTKPVTGHLLGAAGALESAVCALSIQRQMVPLTLNFKTAADGCDLDYVPDESRACRIRVALNISSGFGGKNSCIAMRHYA
jgi:3-oxoacyl-[acyl-carrier-protein] synthase II